MLLMMAEVLQLSRVAKALPGKRVLELSRLPPDTRGMGRLLAARYHPAGLLLPGRRRRCPTPSRRGSPGAEPSGPCCCMRCGDRSLLIALGIFLRSTPQPADLLHVRGYPDSDRPRLSVPVPARLAAAALAVDRVRPSPLRLLAGVGALSGARTGLLLRLPGALEQGRQLRQRLRRLVPQSLPARQAFRRKRRRLSHPELHSHARHHAPRTGRRTLAARFRARHPACAACSRPAPSGSPPDSLLHFAGICPIVKRIWTPAWTLFSGGLCFLFLAAFCWLTEVKGYRKWAFPLVVIGANSIAAYLMAHLWERFILDSFRIHLGAARLRVPGRGVRTLHSRSRRTGRLLGDSVLDVPPQAFP